jgi:hypothetical protein
VHKAKNQFFTAAGVQKTTQAVFVTQGAGFGKNIGCGLSPIPILDGAGNSSSRKNIFDLLIAQ